MTTEFKVFFDNESATQAQLDEIEEIVVEQEINKVWEARVKIPVCVSDAGAWEGEEEPSRSEFTRVRVEIKQGENNFVAVIDGLVVGQDLERSAVPGKSMQTLIVHDDSAMLHRADEIERYDAEKDSDIAREIFENAGFTETQIDDTEARPENPAASIVQSGTKMQILRSLAQQYGNFHAYVLPGTSAGASIGCFKKLPEQVDETLPPLKMFGEDRNLYEFNVSNNAQTASDVVAATLNLRDKSVVTASSSYRDATLLGEDAATEYNAENVKKRRLPPGRGNAVDLESATKGEVEKSSFTLEADGSVLPLCYGGVLQPYRMIPVMLSDSRFSTNYVIFKVVHTLTRSHYTQSFSMKGNSVSAKKDGTDLSIPQASASIAAGFNAQISIF